MNILYSQVIVNMYRNWVGELCPIIWMASISFISMLGEARVYFMIVWLYYDFLVLSIIMRRYAQDFCSLGIYLILKTLKWLDNSCTFVRYLTSCSSFSRYSLTTGFVINYEYLLALRLKAPIFMVSTIPTMGGSYSIRLELDLNSYLKDCTLWGGSMSLLSLFYVSSFQIWNPSTDNIHMWGW